MGNEFIDLFEEWADSYDHTVAGHDLEYKEVFLRYDRILQHVADRAFGQVLEFGPGTGNLTIKLLNKGLNVIGIEPSAAMRKLALEKISDASSDYRRGFFSFSTRLVCSNDCQFVCFSSFNG